MPLPDFVFSTAHKSKGLEFDTVRVADDFTPEYELIIYDSYGTEMKREKVYYI